MQYLEHNSRVIHCLPKLQINLSGNPNYRHSRVDFVKTEYLAQHLVSTDSLPLGHEWLKDKALGCLLRYP